MEGIEKNNQQGCVFAQKNKILSILNEVYQITETTDSLLGYDQIIQLNS